MKKWPVQKQTQHKNHAEHKDATDIINQQNVFFGSVFKTTSITAACLCVFQETCNADSSMRVRQYRMPVLAKSSIYHEVGGECGVRWVG